MSSRADDVKKELTNLVVEGVRMLQVALDESRAGEEGHWRKKDEAASAQTEKGPESVYQGWYTRSLSVVRQVLPDRYQEFQDLYRLSRRTGKIEYDTYTISDYMLGMRVTFAGEEVFSSFGAFFRKLQQQAPADLTIDEVRERATRRTSLTQTAPG